MVSLPQRLPGPGEYSKRKRLPPLLRFLASDCVRDLTGVLTVAVVVAIGFALFCAVVLSDAVAALLTLFLWVASMSE